VNVTADNHTKEQNKNLIKQSAALAVDKQAALANYHERKLVER